MMSKDCIFQLNLKDINKMMVAKVIQQKHKYLFLISNIFTILYKYILYKYYIVGNMRYAIWFVVQITAGRQ